MTEAQILARQLQKTRELNRFYLKALMGCDVHKTFEVNGAYFNSIIWMVGHMAVSENFLINYLCNGQPIKIEWGASFGFGSNNQETENYPAYEEVWETFKDSHKLAIEHIATLTDEDLEKPSRKPFEIANVNTVREAIVHAIRHEGIHGGHLSWLCKFHGVKTF